MKYNDERDLIDGGFRRAFQVAQFIRRGDKNLITLIGGGEFSGFRNILVEHDLKKGIRKAYSYY